MGGHSKHRDSLAPPHLELPSRRGTLDKAAAAAASPAAPRSYLIDSSPYYYSSPWERGATTVRSQPDLNDADEPNISHFSLATAMNLGACASGISLSTSPTERLRGEKARSLLRMLLRSQKTPEEEESFLSAGIHNLVPCGDVVGLLAVIVKQCKDFTPKFIVKRDIYLLVRISIDKIMKCTNPQVYKANRSNRKTETVNFGDVRYFSVKVPKQKSDPRNRISLELVGFEGPKEFPRLFGSVTMHLYDVIQKQSFTEICAMRIRNMVFCTAEVEFMFCYGCLGYGYSHQLKLPGADPAQSVAYSMFLRVPPPENRKDAVTNVIKPQRMDYPACLSPDLNVTVGNIELEPPAEMTDHYISLQNALKEPPRERLQKMKKEYRSLSTWREKAEYLDQLILKRGPKTRPTQPKMSRFREIVEKFHVPRFASSSSQGLSMEESKIAEILPDEITSDEKQPIQGWEGVPEDVSILYLQPPTPTPTPSYKETELEDEMEMATGLVEPTESTQHVPTVAVTTSTSFSGSSEEGDVLEDKVTTGKGGSETSLSSSGETPEFSETREEKFPDIVQKPATLEYLPEQIQSKESFPRSGFPQLVPDEFATPKVSDSIVKSEQQWRWKDSGFQEAVFSGNKFEPFLRRVCKVTPPAPRRGNTHEYRYLEEPYFSDDTKEQEDQDPPPGFPSTKADSGQDTKLTKSGEQLSILRLIEKKMSLEEGHKIATEEEEEPKLQDVSPKLIGDKMSDAEVDEAQIYFKSFLENFLADKLVKVAALQSILSKNIENLVAERLSETQLFQELEDHLKEKQLPEEKRSVPREKFSKPDIMKLKEIVSLNLQTRLVKKFCQQGIIPDLKVAERDEKFSLPSAADLLKIKESEIITIKPLSDTQLEDIPVTEPVVKGTESVTSKWEDYKEALCPLRKKSSLEIIRVKLPFGTETDSSKQRLSNFDILLGKVLKTEITHLKSFLSKKLQDHLKDKLAEIGVTAKDLRTACRRLYFPQKEKHIITPKEVLKEDVFFSEEELAKETPVLSKSMQNLVEVLSEREMANLKSAFNKKIHGYVSKRLSEIEVITEKELQEILKHFFPIVAKEISLRGDKETDVSKKGPTVPPLTQNLHDRFSEEELQNLKSLLGRLLQEDHKEELSESEVKGLTSVLQKNIEDVPIHSGSGTEMNKGIEIKDKSCNIPLTNAEENLKTNDVVVSDRGKEHSIERLHKTPESDEKREPLDLPVNNIFEVETRNQETQTVLLPKRVKHSSKKESHKLPPCPENPEMSLLKRRSFEAGLKSKPSGEVIKTAAEPFPCSSFLSAHDIGVQTEIRNYLGKPNYFTKPSFPVNPQTFLLLHSESEDDAKAPCKYHHKPKYKKKSDRKRDSGPHRSHQTASNAQNKKEKSSSGSSSKEILKEKYKRHSETSSPKTRMSESKKDLKVALSPSTMKKESAKQRAERKRYQEIKPRKSSKGSTLSELFLSKIGIPPSSGHTKGNTLVSTGTDDIDIEAYKHLEKAIERALIDLGRIPDGSSLQGRPNTSPVAVAPASRDSSRSFTNLIETPKNQAGSISEMLHNQEILKMTPDQLEIVLKILQKVLSQNTRPPDNE
ncbi:cation channel sperm-associated targeting subunit tau isoform X3 [Anolis carolinensis]|uniref:cation channel sperm-associated targeting subunit tau isoform X3 n=2 Tax=Anolis carolinensis TaxID=28377 RepID=UPI002F2B2ABE